MTGATSEERLCAEYASRGGTQREMRLASGSTRDIQLTHGARCEYSAPEARTEATKRAIQS